MPRGTYSRVSTPKGGRPSKVMPEVEVRTVIGDPFEEANALSQRSIAHLEMLQKQVEKLSREGSLTAAVQQQSSAVARAIAGLQAQIRQDEKLRKERASTMTLDEETEVVKEWLDALPPDRRRTLGAWFAEAEADSSLLGG